MKRLYCRGCGHSLRNPEVALNLNGQEIARLKAGEKEIPDLPQSFGFVTVYN